MSVLVSDRKESQFESITYSIELHNMLLDLLSRNFGIKDLDHMVRIKYAYGQIESEDFSFYHYQMHKYKDRINKLAYILTNNLRAAKSIYPTSIHEYEKRRDYQSEAIINCEQLLNSLQQIVEIFDVDLNQYGRYIKAISREINLIKSWRQRDNKFKKHLEGNI